MLNAQALITMATPMLVSAVRAKNPRAADVLPSLISLLQGLDRDQGEALAEQVLAALDDRLASDVVMRSDVRNTLRTLSSLLQKAKRPDPE